MFTNQESQNPKAAAETPSTATPLTAEAVVAALQALQAQIGEVTQLTTQQRRTLRYGLPRSESLVQAGINMLAVDLVSSSVGTPAAEVNELRDEANRWSKVEGELRAMLKGIAGANLVRRKRVAEIAARAASVTTQLARNPVHSDLLPHADEIKRLRSFVRRKKAAPPEDTPKTKS